MTFRLDGPRGLIHYIHMTNAIITSLKDLPETIDANTEVCIPGHHLEASISHDKWHLINDETDETVRKVYVDWRDD